MSVLFRLCTNGYKPWRKVPRARLLGWTTFPRAMEDSTISDQSGTIYQNLCCAQFRKVFSPNDWKEVDLFAIPKEAQILEWSKFRYIARRASFHKMMRRLTSNQVDAQIKQDYRQFNLLGFSKGRQISHIIDGMQDLITHAHVHGQSLVVVISDLKTAFDMLRHTLMGRTLRYFQVYPRLVHFMLESIMSLEAKAETIGIGYTEKFKYHVGGPQGRADIPPWFNWLILYVCRDIFPNWHRSQMGYHVGDKRYSHFLWSDNIILTGTSLDQVQCMITQMTECILKSDMDWKRTSLEFFTVNVDGPPATILIPNTQVDPYVIKYVHVVHILGCAMSADRTPFTMTKHNMGQANKTYHKYNYWLQKETLTTKERLKLWTDTVHIVLLNGCSAWTPSVKLAEELRVLGASLSPASSHISSRFCPSYRQLYGPIWTPHSMGNISPYPCSHGAQLAIGFASHSRPKSLADNKRNWNVQIQSMATFTQCLFRTNVVGRHYRI